MLPIIAALVIVAAAALYFFVIRGVSDAAPGPLPTAEYNAGGFTTNIKGSTSRFLKCSVILIVTAEKPESVIETLSGDVSLLQETINFALESFEENDLRVADSDQENIDAVRQSVIDAINEAFEINEVTGVRFPTYVIS
jgi:flagellar basal body-associated protein FliL